MKDIYAYDLSSGSEIRVTDQETPYCSWHATEGGASIDCPSDVGYDKSQIEPDIDGSKIVYVEGAHICKSPTSTGGYIFQSCHFLIVYIHLLKLVLKTTLIIQYN